MKLLKTHSSKYRIRGFTFWDLLIVLVTVGLLAFLWPLFTRARTTPRFNCLNNLRQVGLAFRIWSNDHDDKFPMSVSTNKEGSLELTTTGDVFRHFQSLTNEMVTPRILTCPYDKSRKRTTNFVTFSNNNLSYFVGLDASETDPQMILSGDRNITTNGRFISGILTLTSNIPVRWTKDVHGRCGNLGLSDGSAQQVNDATLKRQVTSSTNLPVRLAIP